MESPRHLTGSRTLAGFPHDLFEAPAERRLGWQLLDSFHPDPAFGASQAMHLHHHGRTIYAPRQVPDLPLPHIVHLVQAATASAALKTPVNRLAPHPQFQCLRLFVQFVPIHPVPRPRQNRRPFLVRQLPSVPKNAILTESSVFECFHEFLRRALITLLLAFSWMVFATRRSALAWESTIQDAFSVAGFGSAIMLLSSPLAWLHYYVLLIPLSLYVMPRISATKEPPRSDGVMTGLVPFVPLLMFSALTESMMRGNAVGVAVVVNSATILTVALAFFKIQRERASVGAARLPAASGRRQSRKSSVHAGT